MPKTSAKPVLHTITRCFISAVLLQYSGCPDEAKYKVSNIAECAPPFRIPDRTHSLHTHTHTHTSNFTRCCIYLYLQAKTLEYLILIAGDTIFPKLPKTINYILKKHATQYCSKSTFHGGGKDGF
jgi:hypothetical protein